MLRHPQGGAALARAGRQDGVGRPDCAASSPSPARRSQAAEIDGAHGGILKLNPLAAWTEAEVWRYIREHDLPVNALHAQGYRSIGCAPCTRAVGPGEDVRAGRWWWESPEHKECGLHFRPAAKEGP